MIVIFMSLQASTLFSAPRLPYPSMPTGESSYLLVLDASGDSAYLTPAQNRLRNRQTPGLSELLNDCAVCLGADFFARPAYVLRRSSENFIPAPEPRYNIVSRK
jgi:hypothetical protein